VSDLLADGNLSEAKTELLKYYHKKIASSWLQPPKTITDLRLNTDHMSMQEILNKANEYLELKFAPDGSLPKVKFDGSIDWEYNPISSREWILRLHRHQWWPVLGLAYITTGNERYAGAFVNQMTDWISNNPPPRQKDERNHAWRLMEVGLRLRVSWIPSFGLFFESPRFYNEAKLKMLRSIYDHANFLFLFKTNRNHLLRESNGLAYTGVYFSEFKEACLWQKAAIERLDKEIERQINPDGSHIEVSTGYQWLVADELEKTYDLLTTNNLKLPSRDLKIILEKIYGVLVHIIRPDGSFPQLNDGFIRWDYTRLADSGAKLSRKDFIYVGTNGREGKEPRTTSAGFQYAGFYIMRSDWTKHARYLIFNAGPYGGPHGHEDKLSIEVFAYGQAFIVDPGSYTYDKNDPYRNYFVGSQAHNIALIKGKSQIRRWKKKNLEPVAGTKNHARWICHEGFDFVEASYGDGFSEFTLNKTSEAIIIKDVIHTRSILFVKPDYWVVLDRLRATENHDYELLFHTSPEITVNIKRDNSVELLAGNSDARFCLVPESSQSFKINTLKGCEEPIQGWYSDDHHFKIPSTAVIFSAEDLQNFESAILLYPFIANPIKNQLKLKRLEVSGGKCAAFAVNTFNGVDYLMVSNNTEQKRFGPFQANGTIAIVRTDKEGKILNRYEEI
jgi:hypothetical protein